MNVIIKRDGQLINVAVNSAHVNVTQTFGLNFFTYFAGTFMPTYFENKIVPRLYKKANAWAAKVIENHSKIQNKK